MRPKQQNSANGKALPEADLEAFTSALGTEITNIYNLGISTIGPQNLLSNQGRGRDLVELDDEFERCDMEHFVGQSYSAEYKDQDWLLCHYTAIPGVNIGNPGGTGHHTGISYHDKMMACYWGNDGVPGSFPGGPAQQDDYRRTMLFPNTLAGNLSWPDCYMKTYNEPRGKMCGLLKGFPNFVFRVVDEDDLQGPITRTVDLVITYFVEIEYIPVRVPRQHFFSPRWVFGFLNPTDYASEAVRQSEVQYNGIITRLMTLNEPVPLMMRNRSTQGFTRWGFGGSDAPWRLYIEHCDYVGENLDINPIYNRSLGQGNTNDGKFTGCFEDMTMLSEQPFNGNPSALPVEDGPDKCTDAEPVEKDKRLKDNVPYN